MSDLDALEALCLDATPGPWHIVTTTFHSCVATENEMIIGAFGMASHGDDPPNARFIAASRAALPDLIAEVRRLRIVEQAARAYCAINGIDRYNQLISALNGEAPL